MALDRSRAVGAGLRGGVALCVGLWKDGTGHAGAGGSAAEAGGGGALSICAEPYVYWVLCGLGRAVGDLRTGEPRCDRRCVRGGAGCGALCVAVRAADAAEEVRRGL